MSTKETTTKKATGSLPDESVEKTRETSKKKQKKCAEFEENLNYIEDVESVKCLGSDKLMVIPTKGISDQLKTQIFLLTLSIHQTDQKNHYVLLSC